MKESISKAIKLIQMNSLRFIQFNIYENSTFVSVRWLFNLIPSSHFFALPSSLSLCACFFFMILHITYSIKSSSTFITHKWLFASVSPVVSVPLLFLFKDRLAIITLVSIDIRMHLSLMKIKTRFTLECHLTLWATVRPFLWCLSSFTIWRF